MDEKILFSLENCTKCTQIKELLIDRNDIKIVTYPHNLNEWTEQQLIEAKKFKIFDDLQITAPILLINSQKIVGYLKIRRWLQENNKD